MLYFENMQLKIVQWDIHIEIDKARMCFIRTFRRELAVLYEGTLRIVRSDWRYLTPRAEFFFLIRTSQLVNNTHVSITDAQKRAIPKSKFNNAGSLYILKAFNDFI